MGNRERGIYKDYVSKEARDVRQRTAGEGIGILIQPVIGEQFDGFFMPLLSGVITLERQQPALRIAIGLGTKAVATELTADRPAVLVGDEINTANIVTAHWGSLRTISEAIFHGGRLPRHSKTRSSQ